MSDEQQVRAIVARQFAAPPEAVFDAWLDPALIGRWMFGPALRDEEVVRLSLDARLGGKFSFVVRRQGQELDHMGEYRAIDQPHRLVFTWGVDDPDESSVVTVEIRPAGSGSEVILTHDMHPDWADYVERTEAAWAKMLGALAAVLA
jgi:uncharacterized protein YndB with AHSA1/START domain